MKPRNKFEKAVLEQSKHLCPITKTQDKWAFRECIDHFAYRLPKGRTTCMDCGHSWVMNKHRETCTCPHCRAKLQVKETYERKLQQKQYFTILTTCGEFQVLRMFLLVVGMEKGYKAQTSIIEIGQYWWNMQGRKAVVAIQRVLGHYVDTFSYYSPMAIRNDNEAYQHIAYSPIYPKFKVTDILRRNGFKDNFYGIVPTKFIPALLTDSRVETLLKAGHTDHLRYFLGNKRTFEELWQSYKIAVRKGYDITDISLWSDYVDTLRRLGKDIHNPKYLCPTDLKGEHDRKHEELLRVREREEIEQKQKKAMEDEKLWLPYRGFWDTMLIAFPIIVLWQSATIMKPINILPTHRYIRSSRLQTYFVEMVLRIISMASYLLSLFLHYLQTAEWKHC